MASTEEKPTAQVFNSRISKKWLIWASTSQLWLLLSILGIIQSPLGLGPWKLIFLLPVRHRLVIIELLFFTEYLHMYQPYVHITPEKLFLAPKVWSRINSKTWFIRLICPEEDILLHLKSPNYFLMTCGKDTVSYRIILMRNNSLVNPNTEKRCNLHSTVF